MRSKIRSLQARIACYTFRPIAYCSQNAVAIGINAVAIPRSEVGLNNERIEYLSEKL